MKNLILLFFVLTLSSAQASMTPSSENCSFYQGLEDQYQCGKKGYPLKFGNRFCEIYLKAEPEMPEKVREWFPKVRLCLQEFLVENQYEGEKACSVLKKAAIKSHEKCYKDTGFCELSFGDKIKIFKSTSTVLLSPTVLAMALKVESICHGSEKKEEKMLETEIKEQVLDPVSNEELLIY